MYDVAIVGYGPVGATLAGLLGKLGLSVVVFEKSTGIYPKPRAVGFDHDAMRLFQRIGITKDLVPYVESFRDEIYIDASGRVIQRLEHIPEPYPLTWSPHYTCDQPYLETVLRDANELMPTINVLLGNDFLDYQQSATSVTIKAKAPDDKFFDYDARYLIGCDGASSPIRHQMDCGVENLNYNEPWIVVDMIVGDEFIDALPQVNVQYCNPNRPCTMICCPGNHRRWEFMVIPGDNLEDALSDDYLWELMAPWLKPGQAEIWRAASYRFHALVAEQWQDSRVFLAGDSAHQTPPFLGQGMCQGLRDAGNLAWKLNSVLSGSATPDLLNTYVQERRPNVVSTTKITIECGLIITELDPDKARQRDDQILAENGGHTKVTLRENLIAPLEDGFIEGTSPLAGTVLPQPLVSNSCKSKVLMDDLMEPCFRIILLADAINQEQIELISLTARAIGVAIVLMRDAHAPVSEGDGFIWEVTESFGVLKSWLQESGCIGVLVRPDHYVYAGIRSAHEIDQSLKSFAGRMELRV
ncbi:bifunctional 3-(3-hydroxy-phenyl)propionate/3-hydroxycinnamic acid hydroxylase [Synechococcus sp. ROS8604]|uniref:bifunctional 3-(3-hydroxy-phenyl)propionate/3-hydroxycinnamic acid hydroxylase n=1 Tax=Synechococcus sp. ROS8604 TaxID=1442557 RepID=UPI0016447D66|nr:bifunctional 3-(3-hydroxy-phenyl)propionate/3-hydroxycinnamic acid hydroxylase [Synechococcus sp. ROS8604]QNI87849.1 FAD binding domain protein [Synechococcus sp. ROS8604]